MSIRLQKNFYKKNNLDFSFQNTETRSKNFEFFEKRNMLQRGGPDSPQTRRPPIYTVFKMPHPRTAFLLSPPANFSEKNLSARATRTEK